MGKYAYDKVLGTQYWVENDPARMEAFYGSREAYESIRSWDDVRPPHYETDAEKARAKGELLHLDHGWDESKSIYGLTDDEIQAAAAFRGGKFLGAVEVSGSSEASAPGSSEPSASSPSVAPASVIHAAGGGLVPVFDQLLQSRSGRLYPVHSFRNYGDGGIGGEVEGQPVLVGTMRFLQDMGVEIPEGTFFL